MRVKIGREDRREDNFEERGGEGGVNREVGKVSGVTEETLGRKGEKERQKEGEREG